MAQHQLGAIEVGWVDKNRATKLANDGDSRITGAAIFTANAGGTTTTLVGANAAPGTNDTNVVRRGEKFRLFNTSGVLKEETVFEITTVAVAGSTTVTFTPAAAGATAFGDNARLIGMQDYYDNDRLDAVLNASNGTLYSQRNLDMMTQNDKIFAVRQLRDPGGF